MASRVSCPADALADAVVGIAVVVSTSDFNVAWPSLSRLVLRAVVVSTRLASRRCLDLSAATTKTSMIFVISLSLGRCGFCRLCLGAAVPSLAQHRALALHHPVRSIATDALLYSSTNADISSASALYLLSNSPLTSSSSPTDGHSLPCQ